MQLLCHSVFQIHHCDIYIIYKQKIDENIHYILFFIQIVLISDKNYYWIFDCLEWEEKHSRTLSTVPQSQRFLESTRMSGTRSQSPSAFNESSYVDQSYDDSSVFDRDDFHTNCINIRQELT
jgi:hypothetical protein